MSPVSPEQLSRSEINSTQHARLTEMLRNILPRNQFWAKKFCEAGIDLARFEFADFTKLPLTTKSELVEDQRLHPPYGTNLSFDLPEYTRLHQTSGTTGRPMPWLDTAASWNWFMECWRQIYALTGVTRERDRFGFPFSFGPFIGFWAAFEGAGRISARTLAAGGMTTEGRLRFFLDHQVTVICCTPTYAMRLAEVAVTEGFDLKNSSIRGLIVAGEPGGNVPGVRERLESAFGARVFDHWGMTDIGSLGIEPLHGRGGLCLLETECIAEILDPSNGKPVAPGQTGELIITNLGRWGQPVLRYRTGDLVKQGPTPAGCGSLIWLEGGVLGRADEMFIVRGNNVFPSAVEAVLREFSEIVEFRMTLKQHKAMPHLLIEIEPAIAEVENSTQLCDRVSRRVKDRLQFQAEIRTVAPQTLPRFEMKGKRFSVVGAN